MRGAACAILVRRGGSHAPALDRQMFGETGERWDAVSLFWKPATEKMLPSLPENICREEPDAEKRGSPIPRFSLARVSALLPSSLWLISWLFTLQKRHSYALSGFWLVPQFLCFVLLTLRR